MIKERLSPKEAADLIGKTPLTLSRWRKAGDGPPYIKVGVRYEYRRDLLLAWRNGDHTHVGEMVRGWPEAKEKPDLSVTPEAFPPIDVASRLISEWVSRERWKRAQYILTGEAFNSSGMLRFEDECALWSDDEEDEGTFVLKSINLQLKAAFHEIGLPWTDWAPSTNDKHFFAYKGAVNLVRSAFEKMFADEKRWRESAERMVYEEDMPMKPPAAPKEYT
jgi:hypothetical protein